MRPYNTRNANNISQFKVKHFFLKTFSPLLPRPKYLQLENLNIFHKKLLKFIRRSGSSVFTCYHSKRVKLLTRLRFGLSHPREHKIKYGFLDSLNPIYSSDQDIKISTRFLLHCSNYSSERLTFLNVIRNIKRKILEKNDLKVMKTLFHDDSSLDDTSHSLIMNATMELLIANKRFDMTFV